MDYVVRINAFDGPMDLLLHLIKKANINIWDICIDEITKQYLAYLHTMKQYNLNVASEYLVMAAELIEIKSKSLLPSNEEPDEEEDSRGNLIQRLIDYSKYKDVTPSFRELEEERKKIYMKEPSMLEASLQKESLDTDISLDDLLDVFQKFLKKKMLEKPLATKVTTKEYSVEERNKEIKDLLTQKKRVSFHELFTSSNKQFMVVTFLSVLDLAKKGQVDIEQTKNFDEIYVIDRGV